MEILRRISANCTARGISSCDERVPSNAVVPNGIIMCN